ncbi:aldo/keto reductase [Actinoplanes sp. CA-015351]|uniref:aldo/keto reductase n=1 Tax=Actinoplanes sp. CA-015351 TaxID=3239897 RepID=UPI003D9892EE
MVEATHSPLVLGAMMFGTTIDEHTSFALLDRFVERGGTWIDTANCYSFWASGTGHGGDSEQILGRWLAARPGVRDQVQIATKLGAEPLGPGSWPDRREGLSPAAIKAAFARSQERLGLDRVDLLWLHQEDRSVPIEDVVDTLAGLDADRFGVSNFPAWLVERGRAHATKIGAKPFDALQLNATYLRPRPGTLSPGVVHRFGVLSDEQADYAAEHQMDLWAYTPLMSGAYDNPAKPIDEVYDHPGNTARLKVLDEVATESQASRSQVVLAWLLSRGIRPMLGGSKVSQLDTALDGVDLKLTDDQLHRLNAVDHSSWADPYPKK